jgi:hypothetical protein
MKMAKVGYQNSLFFPPNKHITQMPDAPAFPGSYTTVWLPVINKLIASDEQLLVSQLFAGRTTHSRSLHTVLSIYEA